ncbi:MAG: aspartate-semialdehyde dehydrogenase, partial [Caulobacteraceae bacterium]
MAYRLAVVGATGAVGREMLSILEEREFPVDGVAAIASRNSLGVEVGWKSGVVKCQDVEQFDFSRVDLVLMSVSGAFSKAWAPKMAAAGPMVIDNSSAWRMDPDVPVIVPEVNPDAIEIAARRNIIANPNCSTAQLVVALKPLHDA